LGAETLLNEEQVAQRLNVAVKTLQKWRVVGGGPRFVKLGRCVRYSAVDLEDFITVRTVPHTAALIGGSMRASKGRHVPQKQD
jgi:predicted DNA-binding transcriptional regulator AlpA